MTRTAGPPKGLGRIAGTAVGRVLDAHRRTVTAPAYLRRLGADRALGLAEQALAGDQTDEADRIADAVLAVLPGSREARLLKAEVYRRRADFDRLGEVLGPELVAGPIASSPSLLQAWAGARGGQFTEADPQLPASFGLLNVAGLRDRIAGRSIVLVGDRVPAGSGERIDGYDLVLRINDYRIDPADTGRRTDIHVAFHHQHGRFADPVEIRILLEPRPRVWRQSIRERLHPGAQQWLGDQSLRWPANQLGVIGADDPYRFPTVEFSVLRTLLQLGGWTALDLIGFDRYGSDAAAADRAANPRQDVAAERAWVRAYGQVRGEPNGTDTISFDPDAPAMITARGRKLITAAAPEPVAESAPDTVAAAEAQVVDGDYAGARDTLLRAVEQAPGPLAEAESADRFLFLVARVRRALSEYDDADAVLRLLCRDDVSTARAVTQRAEIGWIRHDQESASRLARDALGANPAHRAAVVVLDRVRQPAVPDDQPGGRADPPRGGLAHAAFYVGDDGNFGDAALPATVRRSVESVAGAQDWLPVHVHQQFDHARLEQVNAQRGLIIGGGGLFLPDTSPNGNSGWQWNVSTELLRRITVPISVFAVGYNLFPGQHFHGELFRRSLLALAEQSRMLGLRNHGSIDRVADQLPDRLRDRLRYVPCPTTVLQRLHPDLPPARTGTGTVLINGAFDRFDRRFAGGYAEFLRQQRELIESLQSAGAEVRLVAHLPPDERLGDDLRDAYGLRLPMDVLYNRSLQEGYTRYRDADLVIGMRGHATMIPFGLGTPVLSIVSHPKLRYFCEDIGRPDWAVDVGRSDLAAALIERSRDILQRQQHYRDDIAGLQEGLAGHVQDAAAAAVG